MKTDNYKKMQRRIMRRVYYTYGIRLARSPLTLHVLLLAAAVYGVGYFVHVAAVFRNLSAVPVGEVLPWFMRSIEHTEGITLLVLGVSIFALISLPIQLPSYRRLVRMHAV